MLRRLYVSALALLLLVALSSFLGVRQRSTSAAAEGWSLNLTYPAITRAGLAVPLSWEIRHEGGFPEDGKVVMRMTDDYFDLFDENGFDPQPSSEWSDGTYIYWEFDAPPQGDVMRVGSDTRTGSSVQLTRKKGEASIMVDDEPVLTVAIQTWVMP